jgi:pantoate--beta-alanine ligase
MIVFKTIPELKHYLQSQKDCGNKIGFIPTMGALHKGHISLITKAKTDGLLTVCSIFVNPAQFNNPQDFEKYPSSVAEDICLLDSAACDILFLPSAQEIYPNGTEMAPSFDFGYLETIFEGAKRPGHFNGVGKVVSLLLNIVAPDSLYMGSKDYQQCLVVKELCRQMGLNDTVQFIACPTQREGDGLAMSSRNRRLTEDQRAKAGLIYQCLVSIQAKSLLSEPFAIVQKECFDLMNQKGFVPEYINLANADTLEPMLDYDPNQKMLALIATWIGDIRLIDNILIN